jgi:hypothetical protein
MFGSDSRGSGRLLGGLVALLHLLVALLQRLWQLLLLLWQLLLLLRPYFKVLLAVLGLVEAVQKVPPVSRRVGDKK